MSFASPILLLALVAVPVLAVVYILFEKGRERRAATWTKPAMEPNLVHRPSRRIRHIPAILFLLGLTLLLVGFARPKAELTSTREGATVVITIDTSGSMASDDVKPTRILAARQATIAFLAALPKQYKVSLVTFTDHPAVVVQPTYDRKLIIAALPKKTKDNGTQLGGAIKRAVQVAVKAVGVDKPGSPHPPATVLLLSDGKQTQPGETVEAATTFAKRRNVPVNTIALGTPEGKVEQGKVLTGGYAGNVKTYPVPVDGTTLHSIAIATGGRYAQVATEPVLAQVFKDLGTHQAKEHKEHEVTAAAIGLALLFIIPAVLLSGLWFRRVA